MAKKKLVAPVLDLPLEAEDLSPADELSSFLKTLNNIQEEDKALDFIKGTNPDIIKNIKAYPAAREGFKVEDINQLNPGETFLEGGIKEVPSKFKSVKKILGR